MPALSRGTLTARGAAAANLERRNRHAHEAIERDTKDTVTGARAVVGRSKGLDSQSLGCWVCPGAGRDVRLAFACGQRPSDFDRSRFRVIAAERFSLSRLLKFPFGSNFSKGK